MNFRILFYLFTSFVILSNNSFAGDHTISASVELSETAINRYLNTQYNSSGFPRSVTFSYNGTSYTLAISLPEIILSTDNAKISMVFDVNTSTTNIYHFEVQPSINIPSDQITAAQVMAFLSNLSSVLNNIPGLPQWVKDKVIQYYNSLGLVVYPTKLIEQVNTTWLAQRSINIVSPYFALGWQLGQDKIVLTISTSLNSELPSFLATVLPLQGDDYFGVHSNITVTVVDVLLLEQDGTPTFWDASPNVVCTKGQNLWINMGDVGIVQYGQYIAKVLFKIDDTFYSREYGPILSDGNSFISASKAIN